jgi:ubiquitin-protein ligase E3 C
MCCKWLLLTEENDLPWLFTGTLISGSQLAVNIVDMRLNTVYGGGYSDQHPVIIHFWQVLAEMNVEDQRLLLKFVTSCPRYSLSQYLLHVKTLPNFAFCPINW